MLGISCVLSQFWVFFVVHENVCTFLSLSFMKYNVLKIVFVCLFWDSVEKISSSCFVSRQNARFSSAKHPKVTAKKKGHTCPNISGQAVMGSSFRLAGHFPFLCIYRLSAFGFIRQSDSTFLHTFPSQGCYSVESSNGSFQYGGYQKGSRRIHPYFFKHISSSNFLKIPYFYLHFTAITELSNDLSYASNSGKYFNCGKYCRIFCKYMNKLLQA